MTVVDTLPAGRIRDARAGNGLRERVGKISGFPVGDVAPVGSVAPMPVAVDRSLGGFARVRAAGHPTCVFEAGFDDLLFPTGRRPGKEISKRRGAAGAVDDGLSRL